MIGRCTLLMLVGMVSSCKRDTSERVAAEARRARLSHFCNSSPVAWHDADVGCRDFPRTQVEDDAKVWRHKADICFPDQPVVQEWVDATVRAIRFGTPAMARATVTRFVDGWNESGGSKHWGMRWLGPPPPADRPGPDDLARYRAKCVAATQHEVEVE